MIDILTKLSNDNDTQVSDLSFKLIETLNNRTIVFNQEDNNNVRDNNIENNNIGNNNDNNVDNNHEINSYLNNQKENQLNQLAEIANE